MPTFEIRDVSPGTGFTEMKTLPIEIRNVPPGPGFTRLDGKTNDGLPEGVHTGGVWVSPDGAEYWKPLDSRPYANADYHVPTREAECLEMMAGEPAFPRNWRVEESGTIIGDDALHNARRWLVRGKVWVVPDDWPANALRLEHVLEIEQGLRRLNAQGWTVGDRLRVAFDRTGKPFILDLSCACPDSRADDEWWFLEWAEAMGLERLVRLRRDGRHLVSTLEFSSEHGHDYWHGHVYASRNRPISGLWACLSADRASVPGAVYVDADYAKTCVWTWVVTTAPLDDETVRRYELTWAWGPNVKIRR